jgi:hypothetical protein
MFEPRDIKLGMLVRNTEGERLGRVVAREAGAFRIQQPGVLRAQRYVVEDEDVWAIRGAEIILREGPSTVLPEAEYERRRDAGLLHRRNAEGWRRAGEDEEVGDQPLSAGMIVEDVEGLRVGTLTEVGEGRFEVRCASRDELAIIYLGDVLNVLPDRVIVRKGSDVLKERRADREPSPAPLG